MIFHTIPERTGARVSRITGNGSEAGSKAGSDDAAALPKLGSAGPVAHGAAGVVPSGAGSERVVVSTGRRGSGVSGSTRGVLQPTNGSVRDSARDSSERDSLSASFSVRPMKGSLRDSFSKSPSLRP